MGLGILPCVSFRSACHGAHAVPASEALGGMWEVLGSAHSPRDPPRLSRCPPVPGPSLS